MRGSSEGGCTRGRVVRLRARGTVEGLGSRSKVVVVVVVEGSGGSGVVEGSVLVEVVAVECRGIGRSVVLCSWGRVVLGSWGRVVLRSWGRVVCLCRGSGGCAVEVLRP